MSIISSPNITAIKPSKIRGDKPSVPCEEFCCSAFRNDHLQILPSRDGLKNDLLNNSIHPIFARNKFPSLTDNEYKAIELALRLASRLLLSDQLVQYIVTLIDGDMYGTRGNDRKRGKSLGPNDIDPLRRHKGKMYLEVFALLKYPKTGDQRLNDTVRSRAHSILKDLVDMVSFDVEASDSFAGATDPVDGPLTEEASTSHRRGCCSIISFRKENLQEIARLSSRTNPDVLLRLRTLQLQFADSLIHELGHALQLMALGLRPQECFFKNSVLVEAGFDFCSKMWGGILHTPQLRVPHLPHAACHWWEGLVLTEWPSGIIAESYACRGNAIGERDVLDPYELVTRVPTSFVLDLFTTDFWEVKAKTFGSRPLRPDRTPQWVVGGVHGCCRSLKRQVCSLHHTKLPEFRWWQLSKIIHRQQRAGALDWSDLTRPGIDMQRLSNRHQLAHPTANEFCEELQRRSALHFRQRFVLPVTRTATSVAGTTFTLDLLDDENGDFIEDWVKSISPCASEGSSP